MNPIPAHIHRQRGVTLVEALIAFLVLSLGTLAMARVQAQFRMEADIARQRSEAVRLAQEDIETLRAFSVFAAASGARAWASIASASNVVDSSTGYASNTRYTVARNVAALPNAKTVHVAVHWADRGGAAQQVVLNSIISASDPARAGALAIAPSDPVARGVFGRSARVPQAARDLGDG
ncbi:MAG TPA: prepilin-type N-terminal cleavage/methylation domain-containing protein, partial [Burkholderiaceae bacterium]|nr:prepilin-type N-terminal cleavage/methylation domain-containing protein [Burkholderiaceae bacterium]